MTRQSAHLLRRKALGILLGLCATAAIAQEDVDALSQNQAREALVYALKSNQIDAAYRLASGLLQQDPSDPSAHYAMGLIYSGAGDPRAARKSGRSAYRFARTDLQTYSAASLNAQLAFREKRFTQAQYWLRKAHTAAPSDVQKHRVVRNFKQVRSQNPFRFHITGSLAPSSNVNNGSMSKYMIIDGVPAIGVNIGDALALSGIEAMVNARLSYRLRTSSTSETRMVGRFFSRQVALSSEAKDIAPNAKGSDYSFSLLEAGLRHAFRIQPKGPIWNLGVIAGTAQYGGSTLHDLLRAEAGVAWTQNKSSGLSLTATNEWRRPEAAPQTRDIYSSLSATYSHKLSWGDQLSTSISLHQTDDATPIFDSHGAVAALRYTFTQPKGPVRIAAALKAGMSAYPNYRVGIIPVPGGRQDISVASELEFTFHKMHYAGFAPTMTVRALTTSSNVSRFDTREYSVSIGIQSAF